MAEGWVCEIWELTDYTKRWRHYLAQISLIVFPLQSCSNQLDTRVDALLYAAVAGGLMLWQSMTATLKVGPYLRRFLRLLLAWSRSPQLMR